MNYEQRFMDINQCKSAHLLDTGITDGYSVRMARRYYPDGVSFCSYIDEVNHANVDGRQIKLMGHDENISTHAHRRLFDVIHNTVVAFPQISSATASIINRVPDQATACLPDMMSMQDLVQGVISSILQQHNPTAATQKNVLCAGYSIAHENGTGSALRNLDVRSPSAPINILLTQTWRTILSRVGSLVLRHLLKNAILLIAVNNEPQLKKHDNGGNDAGESNNSKWAFIQLCGPQTELRFRSFGYRLPRSASVISVQRDVFYQNRHGRGRIVKQSDLPSSVNLKLGNDALPKKHHLNLMPASLNHAAAILVPLIFRKQLNHAPNNNGKALKHSGKIRKKQLPTDIRQWKDPKPFRDYDNDVYKMLKKKAISSESETDWKRIPKRLKKQFSPLLKKMIWKLRKTSLRRVLGRSCPLPARFRVAVEKCNKSGSASLSVEDLINMNVMGEKVAQFVLRCIHNIFPKTIFGSDLNWKIFHQAVHTLIERQLKEQFDVVRYFSQHAFKITDVPWLYTMQKEGIINSCHGDHGRKIRNPTDLKFRQMCMDDFLIWLFRGIIIPLLQHNFCMTEGNLDKNRVFFFHREVWTHMLNITNKQVLRSNGQFRILSSSQLSESVASRAIMNSKLGDIGSPCSSILYYHRMRFIPKRKSLRWIQLPRYELISGFNLPGSNHTLPITKLKNQRRSNEQFSLRCIRLLMNQIVRILIAESRVSSSKQIPSNLGASVFSLDDIYSKWVSLKDKWVRRHRPKMYVCCVDITQSFDTIPLTELLDNVVPNILSKARYPVVRLRVCKKNPVSRQFIYQTINHVCTKSGDETSLCRLLTKQMLPRHAGSIVSDCANVTSLQRDDILAILKEFIAKNLVAVPRRVRSKKESGFALQIQGVPQGHPLSPILTTLFYGHVERQDLVEFFEGDTSQTCTAKNTTKVSNLEKHCPPNSLTANDNPESNEKKELDFGLKMPNLISLFMRQMDDTIFICNDISHSTKFLKRMISGWEFSHGFSVNPEKTKSSFKASVGGLENLKVLPWCGLLINVDTLEIRSDYSRYSCLRDHVTIEHEWESGRVWMQRSLAGFNPKVHPIFFDHRINSSFTICVNVYQAAVLCGLKVCSSLLALRHVQNPQFVSSGFRAASDNFSKIISQAMVRNVASVERKYPFILSSVDIKFLTVCAFKQCVRHAFLSNKQQRRVIGNTIMCKLTECCDVLRAKVCKRQGGSKLVETVQKIAEEECSFFWSIEL